MVNPRRGATTELVLHFRLENGGCAEICLSHRMAVGLARDMLESLDEEAGQ